MKRLVKRHGFGLAALVALSVSLAATPAIAAQPTIHGPTLYYNSAALWYLGPGGASTGYNTSTTLTATAPPGDTNPDPSIYWSVNYASLLQLFPSGSPATSALIVTKGPSYTTQQTGVNYNIQVTVTWDGMVSAPFPVFNNVPYSNTVVNAGQFCNSNGCDCDAIYPGQNDSGYTTLNQVYVRDLFGNVLTPINLHETLENIKYTNGWANPPVRPPTATSWIPSYWTGYWFPDYFGVCLPPGTQSTPPVTGSGSGGTAGLNLTQKYWIGTTSPGFGLGICTQANVSTLYTNNGAESDIQIPGFPSTICNMGQTLN